MMLLRTLDCASSIPAGMFHVKERRLLARLIEIGNNMSNANSYSHVGEHDEAIRIQVDGTACGQR